MQMGEGDVAGQGDNESVLSLYFMYCGSYLTVYTFLNSPNCTFKMNGFYMKIQL